MNHFPKYYNLLLAFMLLFGTSFTPYAQATSYLVITNADSGRGSLRNAINYANQHPATPITFKIPTSVMSRGAAAIVVKTPLPPITADGTIIDAATQPAANAPLEKGVSADHPRVVLKGTDLETEEPAIGLIIKAANCHINKIAINDFSGAGIVIVGASSQGNKITGCYLGTSAQGIKSFPNGEGLIIGQGANGNVIGGLSPDQRNVISGNGNNGVVIGEVSASHQEEDEGTYRKVAMHGSSNANLLAGPAIMQRARSLPYELELTAAEVDRANVIEGNYIGTAASGQAAIPNGINGIEIEGNALTTIGGTQAGARNVISGNGWAGILMAEAHNNVIAGNYIGTDAGGSKPLGNGNCGINVSTASKNNIIGGTTPEARNVISGNPDPGAGIALRDPGTEQNLVTGNYIGTDASGTRRLGNVEGISIMAGAQFNTVGGTTPGARNVISGNKNYGVVIYENGTTHNTVAGNFIGTDITGTVALSDDVGIIIKQSASNIIGGLTAGSGNLISGNKEIGVRIEEPETNNNQVQGNIIGLDAVGKKSLPNDAGVVIQGGPQSNLIGGSTPEARNVIAGNSATGVEIHGNGTSHNTVAGNFIGTDISGKIGLGNGITDINVYLSDGATSNMIGGVTRGTGNIIAFNDYGVAVKSPQTNGNAIRGNFIRANNPTGKHLGITLYATPIDTHGVLAPHQPGSAVGPNHLLNYPLLEGTMLTPTGVTFNGFILGQPGQHYNLDFFASPITTPLRYGEGEVYLGSLNLTMTGANNTKFTWNLPGDFHNQSFTATLTDLATGDTSEFSPPAVPVP